MSLNVYGDVLVDTTGLHGADIASQRMDDLDRRSLKFALDLSSNGSILDVGCGLAVQSMRFALLGGNVMAIDINEEPQQLSRFRDLFPSVTCEYVQQDIRAFQFPDREGISLLFSQRTFHYLRYSETVAVLRGAFARMLPSAQAFVSMSGLHSELGLGYGANNSPLEQRFAKLADAMAEKHHIREPVCLYSEDDARRLADDCGLRVRDIWSSSFGNIKVVMSR